MPRQARPGQKGPTPGRRWGPLGTVTTEQWAAECGSPFSNSADHSGLEGGRRAPTRAVQFGRRGEARGVVALVVDSRWATASLVSYAQAIGRIGEPQRFPTVPHPWVKGTYGSRGTRSHRKAATLA